MIKCNYKHPIDEFLAFKKPCKCTQVVDYLMHRVARFNVFDFAALKMCLISGGILIGSKFSNFFKKVAPFLFITFIVSYVFVIFRLFVCDDE